MSFDFSSTVNPPEESIKHNGPVLLADGRTATTDEDSFDQCDLDLSDSEMEWYDRGEPPIERNWNHESASEVASSPSEYAAVLGSSVPSIVSSQAVVLVGDGKYPDTNLEKYDKDKWTEENSVPTYYVRNQSRLKKAKATMSELDIQLDTLELLFSHLTNKYRLWFHATGWQSADKKRHSGPIMSKGELDLAVGQAFYLNPHYDDCYEWLVTKNSVYHGKHAILIYRFDLADLGGRGKELGLAEWKSVARQWSTIYYPDDWTYTFQNSDPENVAKQGHNVTPRYMSNGSVAMQLVIRTKELCAHIHQYLVGCIYFENLNDVEIDDDLSRSRPQRSETGKRSRESVSNKSNKRPKKAVDHRRDRC